MRAEDIIGVVTVEHASYPYPWSRRIFEDCLRAGYCCLVAETGRGIVAHGIMLAAADEAHILNICVHPGARRVGIAWHLLHELLEIAYNSGMATAFLEVRPSNTGAIDLYERAGFHRVGQRRGYYPAAFGREDALVMARALLPPET
jgi:ribosomal-protein-alanine N-acetyltransferase